MEQKDKKLLGRLSLCALLNIVLVGILIFVGHIFFSDFILQRNFISSNIFMVLTGLLISVIWIFAYMNLDAIKREPLKDIIAVFALSVVFKFFFESLLTFIAKNPYVALDENFNFLFEFVSTSISSTLAILCVFKIFVFKLEAFDEAVDALIYGGVSGVGIALSQGVSSILKSPCVSFDFMLLNFSVMFSLVSLASALAGYLLYRVVSEKERTFDIVISYILIPLVLGFVEIAENQFSKGIFIGALGRSVSVFLKTSIFCVGIFVFIVALIFLQLKKDDFVPVKKGFAVADIIILVVSLSLAIVVRVVPDKNEKFSMKLSGSEKTYSFELPNGFEIRKQSGLASVFKDSESENSRFINRSMNGVEIQIDCVKEEIFGLKKSSLYCFSFDGEDEKILMTVFMGKKDDTYAEKIVLAFSKNLEVVK